MRRTATCCLRWLKESCTGELAVLVQSVSRCQHRMVMAFGSSRRDARVCVSYGTPLFGHGSFCVDTLA